MSHFQFPPLDMPLTLPSKEGMGYTYLLFLRRLCSEEHAVRSNIILAEHGIKCWEDDDKLFAVAYSK